MSVNRLKAGMVASYKTTQGPVIIYGRGGGTGFKSGGHRKYFEGQRVGIEKILRSPEGASKYFSVKIFAADAASFVSPQYSCELQKKLHNLHMNSTPKYMNILHQKGASKWAAKFFFVKSHLNPIPSVIDNDRSLIRRTQRPAFKIFNGELKFSPSFI